LKVPKTQDRSFARKVLSSLFSVTFGFKWWKMS
jgi:hypothetical protein